MKKVKINEIETFNFLEDEQKEDISMLLVIAITSFITWLHWLSIQIWKLSIII